MKENKKNSGISILIIILGVVLIVGGLMAAFFLNGGSKEELKNDMTPKTSNITPLMYEVTKEGSDTKIYLFGSIHATNANDSQLPDYVMNAYKESSHVACEYDMVAQQTDVEAQQLIMESLRYSDGTTIKDHLSTDTYDHLIKFLKESNSYNEAYEEFKPALFYELVEQAIATKANISLLDAIDSRIVKKAKEDNKTILEVESFEFQLNLLLDMSDRLYEIMINNIINNPEYSVKQLKDLYDAWKKGDPDKLLEVVNAEYKIENYNEEDLKLLSEYNKNLLTNRNVTMTNKLEDYFNAGYNTFFMVGTGHLIGEDGIANLLIQRGYTVKQVNK